MKTAGIIGGIGPESTLAYYKAIMSLYRERAQDETAPSVLINSIDMNRMRRLIEANRLDDVITYLAAEIERLERAGATFGLLAAVTPHLVFDDLRWRVQLPLISIVETTRKAAEVRGLRRLAIFGTRFTMQASFFPVAFAKTDIDLVLPSREEQNFIHEKYFAELVNGIFHSETREQMLAIVDRLKRDEAIDGVILGGTELPLLLNNPSHSDVAFLNTSELHVAAVVDELLS